MGRAVFWTPRSTITFVLHSDGTVSSANMDVEQMQQRIINFAGVTSELLNSKNDTHTTTQEIDTDSKVLDDFLNQFERKEYIWKNQESKSVLPLQTALETNTLQLPM